MTRKKKEQQSYMGTWGGVEGDPPWKISKKLISFHLLISAKRAGFFSFFFYPPPSDEKTVHMYDSSLWDEAKNVGFCSKFNERRKRVQFCSWGKNSIVTHCLTFKLFKLGFKYHLNIRLSSLIESCK